MSRARVFLGRGTPDSWHVAIWWEKKDGKGRDEGRLCQLREKMTVGEEGRAGTILRFMMDKGVGR